MENPTIEDLRTGRVVQLSTAQYARLKGLTNHSIYKARCEGRSIPFKKVGHRCWYLAADVLKELEATQQRYSSTAQYEKPAHLKSLDREENGRLKCRAN